jgi:hypothetical protein
VTNFRWSRDRVRLANVTRLRQHGGSNPRNITNIYRADARVSYRRKELSLFGDLCLERKKALKIEIRPQERIVDS